MNDHREVLQDAATATGVGTAMCVGGHGTACFQVEGTFVGTITWQARLMGAGGTWVTVQATNLTTGNAATTATAAGIYRIDVRALGEIRANITAYTSGTITVTGNARGAS